MAAASLPTAPPSGNNLQCSFKLERPAVAASERANSFLALLHLDAPSDHKKERAPLDLVCVVDRSGSMRGAKLDMVKHTLRFVVSQLHERDSLGIVTYHTTVAIDHPAVKMDATGKASLERAIERIETDGYTNLSGGLFEGLNVLDSMLNKNEVASCLLLTDGVANEGVTDQATLCAAVRKRESRANINCMGVGSDCNATMLKAIAEAGRGLYYFLADVEGIPKCFSDCLGGLLSTVAQNINITLRAEPGVEVKNVLTKWPVTVVRQSLEYSVKLHDIQSEEKRDVLVELSLPDLPTSSADADMPLLSASLNLFNVLTAEQQQLTCAVCIPRPRVASEAPLNIEVDVHHNRWRVTDALERAIKYGDAHDLKAGRDLIQATIDAVERSPSAKEPPCVRMLVELRDALSGMRDREQYRSHGTHALNSYVMEQAQQRSAGYEAPQLAANPSFQGFTYSTSSRAKTYSNYQAF